MFTNIKKIFRWGSKNKSPLAKEQCRSLILKATIKVLEDILTWKKMWLSVIFMIYINFLFLICIHKDLNLLQLVIIIAMVLVSVDAFETWLKYKHRETFLRRMADNDCVKLYQAIVRIEIWISKKWSEFIFLRETNHTKAFLLVNMLLGIIFFIGKSLSGFTVLYLLCMSILVSHLLLPYIQRAYKKIQHAESDAEIDNMIPEVSEQDMKELIFDFENTNKKQSLDYWKLENLPAGDTSDSSDTSSSLVTNLSKDKLENNMDNSSNSSDDDDEYIPLVQGRVQSTLDDINTPDTWTNSTYNVLRSLTGTVANMIYSQPHTKIQRASSADSSDGFEVIDKNDLT